MKMKVLELYSGIGGMHLALQESGINYEVIASVDINTVANSVYKHNFPNTNLHNRNIQSLSSDFINKLNVDTILMSPPCQPFTRNGLKQDVSDARSCSFTHILQVLPELNIENILIENVKGFDDSLMHARLLNSLREANYEFQEFMLSPTQFGIPNTRHRYYCLAKKQPKKFPFEIEAGVREHMPSSKYGEVYPIVNILEENIDIGDYLIPEKILLKRANILDICYKESCRSCCFTKAYGRYVEGTGSVYTNKSKEELDEVYNKLKNYEQDPENYLLNLRPLNMRFFTPKEISRLMSFPETFSFPNDVNTKQRYMLLGNSINVKVVSELIKLLA